MAGFKKTQDGVGDMIKGYLDRANLLPAYLNRTVYQQYKNRQNQRWITENVSEGIQWKPLTPKYKEYKLKKFAQYEGAGSKTMIATGQLRKDVAGGGPGHKKTIEGKALVIAWSTPYSIYTEDIRPVNVWDKSKDKEMYDAAAAYLINAQIKNLFGGG